MALTDEARIATLSSYVPQAVLRSLARVRATPREAHEELTLAALLLIDVTGFTPITEAAIRRGPRGAEHLSRSFNAYLGQLIDLVWEHGGDISKIVGDALIPLWFASDHDLATVTRRAAACALAIGRQLGDYEETDLRLSVKVGLCAGETAEMHVGGMDGRWLFVVAGSSVRQLSELEPHLVTGDVIASPAAWSLISDQFVGQPVRGGHVRVRSNDAAIPPRALDAVRLPPEREEALRGYIPQVLLSRVDAGQQEWLAELRRTSVVFVNVRGIPDATSDALLAVDRIAKTAQRVAARYDGWPKEVTMDEKGTTLTVVFGVPPFTHEDDAARAVAAALALESEIRANGLGAAAGIARGPTFCGPVGNAKRQDFAMLGGHVNLAARLMQAAEDGAVLCDAATHEEALHSHLFDRLPAYVLKGLGEPTDVYRVRIRDAVAEQPSGLVDRAAELATAVDALDELKAGGGRVVILEGDPGIGKSRVVAELSDRAKRMDVMAFVGHASEIEQSTQYHAWRGILESMLGVAVLTDPAGRAAALRQRLAAAQVNVELAPLLGPLLSLDLPDNDLTDQLTGEMRADNTLDVVIGVLRAASTAMPVMIVIEDVHWLDSASWQLVLRVRSELPGVLFVMTTRPIADAPSDAVDLLRAQATMLRLAAFSRQDAVTLAAQRSGANELDEAVATLVHERAEGNPLFIEQLTYAMRDSGQIVVDRGVLRSAADADGLSAATVPDSVQRVITTRLDQLAPQQAMTLKVASVIGQRFAVRTLADIHPLSSDSAALEADLRTLTRLGLVAPTPAPEASYEFRHKITQEVAYSLMPTGQSRQLHRKLAAWYEGTYPDALSPFLAFLAHHWRLADVPARAVEYLERAGLEALRTFANEEAIDFLEEALALAAQARLPIDPTRRARWLLSLGEAYVHLSRYRDGREYLQRGLRLLKRSPPTLRGQGALSLVGQITRQVGHRVGIRGHRRLTDAQRDELVAVSRAYERLAEASYYEGDAMLALYSSIRILNEAEASSSAPEIARGLAGTGALFGLVPLRRVAQSYLRQALARLEQVEDAATHEIVRIVVGFYYVGAGMWEPAREQLKAVRSIASRLGDRRRLQDAVGNLLAIEYLQGSVRSANDLADDLVAMARARADRRFEADALVGRAYAALEMDRTAESLRALDEIRQIGARDSGLPTELRIKTHGLLALVQLARGDRRAASAAAEEAMRLTAGERPTYFATFFGYVGPAEVYLSEWQASASAPDSRAIADDALERLRRYAGVFPIGRPRYELLRGRRSWLLGQRGTAHRQWRKALDEASRLSMGYEQALAHHAIGGHLHPGDPERTSHLTAAREKVAQLGATRLLAMIDAAELEDAADG